MRDVYCEYDVTHIDYAIDPFPNHVEDIIYDFPSHVVTPLWEARECRSLLGLGVVGRHNFNCCLCACDCIQHNQSSSETYN